MNIADRQLACYPLTGFCLTLLIILALTFYDGPQPPAAPVNTKNILDAPVPALPLFALDSASPNASLADHRGKDGVVLYFLSGQCGLCRMLDNRVERLIMENKNKNVVFFGVRCTALDSKKSLQAWGIANHLDLPLLDDADENLVHYFHVTHTPDFVVIDRSGILRYRGAFDDNVEEKRVTQHFVRDALASVLANRPVATASHPAVGCTLVPFPPVRH